MVMERLQRCFKCQGRLISKDTCPCDCTLQCVHKFVIRMFPFLTILQDYSLRYDLPRDVVAGLTVGILHVPQGMAYVLLAGLPPVYGLYTSLYPSVIYFFFGTSRHASVGTFVVASLMVGAIASEGVAAWEREHPPLTHYPYPHPHLMTNASDSPSNTTDDASYRESVENVRLAYAMSATFAVGFIQIVLGLVGVGRVASFMSDALISGFTMGIAMHVLPSQLHSIFGLPFAKHSGMFIIPVETWEFFRKLPQTQWVPLVTSLVAILILVVIKEGVNNNKIAFPHLHIPIPVELLLLIGGTLLSYYVGFEAKHHVKVIGVIPKGIPRVDVSVLRFVPQVMGKALVPAFTFFALSFAAAKIVADRHGYSLDANQELIALGMANFLGPFFSSFSCNITLSRTMVQDEVGGKTQVTSLISSLLVLVVLLFIGPFFHSLPNCVLAAIIVVSLKRLYLQCTLLPRLWRVSKTDFTVWIVVFLATVLVDLHVGLVTGFIINLIIVLFRTQTPYVCLLGKADDRDVYADVNGHLKVREVPGVKIFRFEAALYFGNVQYFRSSLERETGLNVNDLITQGQTESLDEENHDADWHRQDEFLLPASTFKDYQTLEDNSISISTPFPTPCQVKVIVVDGSPIQTLDSLTLTVLTQIIKEYKEVGIDVILAECKPAVSAMLETSGFLDHVGQGHVFDTIHQAVSHAAQCSFTSFATLPRTLNHQ